MAVLIFALSLVSSFSGCSFGDGTGYTFKYALLSEPQNLDPQFSTDFESIKVMDSLFEGLLKTDEKGNIVKGVIEDYKISDDGLLYTFYLKKDVFWYASNGFNEKLTAHDFVFAFKRLFDYRTKSPNAYKFFSIKNSEQVYSNRIGEDSLGVKAIDDYTLTIELNTNDPKFLNLLTTSPAYPCNETFFYETKGKYGLEASTVASNGNFYLKSWSHDTYNENKYLVLKRHPDVKGVAPSGINYFVTKSVDLALKEFKAEDTNIFISDGSNGELFEKNDYKYTRYEDTSIGLIFNPDHELLKVLDIRKALVMAINRSELLIPDTLKLAYGLIPKQVDLLGGSYRDLVPEKDFDKYDLSLAKYLWEASLSITEKSELAGTTVIVPESFSFSEYVNGVTDQWQKYLILGINVEVLSDDVYEERIRKGDYAIALTVVKGKDNDPREFFKFFERGESQNIANLSYPALENKLNAADNETFPANLMGIYASSEAYLIDNFYYVPLFYGSTYVFYNKDTKGLVYNPFREVFDFRNAKNFD